MIFSQDGRRVIMEIEPGDCAAGKSPEVKAGEVLKLIQENLNNPFVKTMLARVLKG